VAGSKAQDIVVVAPVSWTASTTLTLDAYRSLTVNKPVSVLGSGGLAVLTNHGGTDGSFSFGSKGNVTFWSTADSLSINGSAYTLVSNIATLASDIAANPSGHYALSASYDASADGTYASAPIPTFNGTFEGLGNAILHLTINDPTMAGDYLGLFAYTVGRVENLGLKQADIQGFCAEAGALAGRNDGTIVGSYVTGKVTSTGTKVYCRQGAAVGGLVYANVGAIYYSHSAATVSAIFGDAGGLAADSDGYVDHDFATGSVKTRYGRIGGLLGIAYRSVKNSFATGSVQARSKRVVAGGLIGQVYNISITNSYATGDVTGTGPYEGGFIGRAGGGTVISQAYAIGHMDSGGGFAGCGFSPGSATATYWDTDTAGVPNGDGCVSGSSGGLTTEQFTSGLPPGFDPSIWAENPSINGGFPYLLGNPPL
jgi:hypothetical protein